jgi:hypothetical protein
MQLTGLNSRIHKLLVLFILLLFILLSGAAQTSAKTITAQSTQDLRIALGQDSTNDQSKVAVPGDTIILIAGTTYTGTFVLPNLSNPNNLYITLQSSALSSLPAGKRVQPSDKPYMPVITSPGFGSPAIETARGASYYRLLGIEFTMPDADVTVYDIVALGYGNWSNPADTPGNLIIDRCYVHGRPTRNVQRGISLQSKETSVTNSYISDIHARDFDAQGISGFNGPGPFNITNNYVEASGENIMFGGGPPALTGNVPSNITIRGNHLYKPLKWQPGSSDYANITWNVKNLFELKSAKYVTVEGNVMENNWEPGSYGALNLTVSSDGGPQATIQHVTIRNNIIRNMVRGVLIKGLSQDGAASVQGHHITIANNLFDNVSTPWNSSDGEWIAVGDMNDLVVDHNTVFFAHSIFFILGSQVSGGSKMTGLVVTNNILNYGSYGFVGPSNGAINGPTVFAETAIQANFLNPQINNNVLIDPGQHQNLYPTYNNNNYWPASTASVNFVNYANHNFRLVSGSFYTSKGTDGKDMGADMNAIEVAISGGNGSTIVRDTFTDASGTLLSSHVGETGAKWTKHPSYSGNAYISNANRERGNALSLYYASGVPASADYDVQADFVGAQSLANRVGIAGRINTSADTYYRVSYSVPNSAYELQLVNAGTATLLQSANPAYWGSNFDNGQTHNVKLQMRGSSLKVFVDGAERISVTNSTITAAGRAGVYTGSYDNSDTWGIHIDNFNVTGAPSTQPAQFVSDTFTGASATLLSSHTGETGATWVKHPAYANNAYISNANRMRGDGDSMYYASGVPGNADYDVQADLCGMAQTASTTGIAGRVNASGDTSYRVIFSTPSGKYHLQVVNAGVVTQLQEIGPWQWGGNFADGATHTVKLQLRGSSIKVFIDGVERMSATDSTITAAGRVGVYTRSYSMTDTWGIHIDNLTATNAP